MSLPDHCGLITQLVVVIGTCNAICFYYPMLSHSIASRTWIMFVGGDYCDLPLALPQHVVSVVVVTTFHWKFIHLPAMKPAGCVV